MSETKTPVPERASGHLVYFGTDKIEDIQGAIGTIGAALHFAADHLEQFRDETTAHNEKHQPGSGPRPTAEEYRACLVFTHDMISPDCAEPIP